MKKWQALRDARRARRPLTDDELWANADRFWARVDKSGGCWLWIGSVLSLTGYGRINVRDFELLAHRLSYFYSVGSFPAAGLTIDHLCRVPACVNPDHLEPVTSRVNTLRGTGPTAENAAKTHCKRGHPFDGDNLRIHAEGYRVCRTCRNATAQRKRDRKRAAA